MSRMALVEEVPVWLEINKQPAVSWMCTPERLEDLVIGWLYGEGYIQSMDDVTDLRPCPTDLGFWVELDATRVAEVEAEDRKRVLASGCGAVTTPLSDPATVKQQPRRGAVISRDEFRRLFKQLFQAGSRYQDTGGIHAAALVDGGEFVATAEDIGRHNAVDKVIGQAVIERRDLGPMGLLVTGRISAELAFKAARAGLVYVATPSVPSTLAADIAGRSGMTLVGRAVSGEPHVHEPPQTEGIQ